jgi:hypothetical protein
MQLGSTIRFAKQNAEAKEAPTKPGSAPPSWVEGDVDNFFEREQRVERI